MTEKEYMKNPESRQGNCHFYLCGMHERSHQINGAPRIAQATVLNCGLL